MKLENLSGHTVIDSFEDETLEAALSAICKSLSILSVCK